MIASIFFNEVILLFNEVLIVAKADDIEDKVSVSSSVHVGTTESLMVVARVLIVVDFFILLAIDLKLSINVMKSAHDIEDLESLFVEELILSVTSSIESTIDWSFLILFLIWDWVNSTVDPTEVADVMVLRGPIVVLKIGVLFVVITGEEKKDERPNMKKGQTFSQIKIL